jgi:hypothetical protein
MLAVFCVALCCSTAAAETVESLKKELAAKQARIKQLERRHSVIERQQQGPSSWPIASRPSAGPSSTQPDEPAPTTVVVPAVPRAGAAPADADDDLDRALERTLVREGALVLPPWVVEATPQFSFAHWDKVQDPYVRNSYSASLTMRMGLPWSSQVAVSLPYGYSEYRDGTHWSGVGDAGIQLSKELAVETGWTPNLVGSVGWTSPTRNGNSFGPVPFVSGFQAGLTASKRLDPLVVFGSVNYFSAASRDIAGTRFDPADVFAARGGASMALSPATSMTAGFSMAYLLNTHPADFILPGSDKLISTADIGFTTILWKRTLLNVTAQFGVTGHTPDFRLITSIPVRF